MPAVAESFSQWGLYVIVSVHHMGAQLLPMREMSERSDSSSSTRTPPVLFGLF